MIKKKYHFTAYIISLALLVSLGFKAKSAFAATKAAVPSCSAIKLARYSLWSQAFRCASSQHDHALQKALLWLKYRDQNNDSTFEEIVSFIEANPHFPDKQLLISVAESKLSSSTDASKAREWFKAHTPSTSNGLKYYLSSYQNSQDEKFISLVKQAWIQGDFNRKDRAQFLEAYGKHLSQADHVAKIQRLLKEGNKKIEADLLKLVNQDYNALFKATLMLTKGHGSNIQKVLQDVPQSLRDSPSLLYAQALWYRKKGDDDKAARLILENENVLETKSDKWFNIRALVVTEIADKGDYANAYKIAKSHAYKEPSNYVDGEWLAGKIAYFYLKKNDLALAHFVNILNHSKLSVSISRGAYWAGVVADRLGHKVAAQKYFARAALYPDNFYGQLAILKANNNNNTYLLNEMPSASPEDMRWLENNELVKISHFFNQENQYGISRKFMVAAASTATTPIRRYLVAKSGSDNNALPLAVISSKEAARRGNFFVEYSYPILEYVPKNSVEAPLILSVIRQESEFHPMAMSSAGAMGLMQLVYPTAKDMANSLKMKLTKISLFRNPILNVKFGSHYLSKLLKEFNGSYILAISAYNAGPSPINRWIKKYGDPRELNQIDQVVEWIEKIPYHQTRAYVQHVLSNMQIYRNILRHDTAAELKHIKININQDLLKKS